MRLRSILSVLAFLGCLASSQATTQIVTNADPASGSDWPSWSGPNGDLTVDGVAVFEAGVGLESSWKRPLGSGYSGIVVSGGRLVTAYSDGKSDLLVALDPVSGETQWRYHIAETYAAHDGSDDGPLATPTIHDGTVFGLGGHGRLVAVRLEDGQEVWSRQLVGELGASEPFYGFATAPTIVSGVLIVQTGGTGGHSISALDPGSGKLLWSVGDDHVTYQSPTALRVGEEDQVFAVTDRHLLGLAPRTGKILWQHEHREEDGAPHFTNAQAVPLGDGRVLLSDGVESICYRVEQTTDGYRLVELWRSRALHRSYASALPYRGHLYGYTMRRFLTCVDAATGETVWKSRAPGGGHLMLVDGHLVILAPSGEVVVAEATPEGYREKNRIQALDRGYFTRPSFALNRIFVRNLTEIASIAVNGTTAAATMRPSEPTSDVPLLGKLGPFVRSLETTSNKWKAIDEFLATYEEFPILEGEDLVHFVFRGEVDDLVLVGNMQLGEELPMLHVEGTDLYVRSMTLEPNARFEYAFGVFDQTRIDPLNPRRSAIDDKERSVLTTQGWEAPEHLAAPMASRDRKKLTWSSEMLDNQREVEIYLPPAYDDSDERYPLLIVLDGEPALEWGLVDRSLENLVGRTVAPLVVAFVPYRGSEDGSDAPIFAEALVNELLPRLDATYRTIKQPLSRALMAPRWAGSLALYTALKRPGVFGKLAVLSQEVWGSQRARMFELLDGVEDCDLDIRLEWSRHGYASVIEAGERMVEALRQAGCRVKSGTFDDGMGWGGWRRHTNRQLEALFPLE